MTLKSKAFLVGGLTFCLTLIVTLLREIDLGNIKAIWLIWICMSWNYFAYAFDRGMWPRAFVELDGADMGNPTMRSIYFWGTAGVYLAFLATVAFANR